VKFEDTWQMNDEATRDSGQFVDSSQFPVAKFVDFGKVREDWTSPGKNRAIWEFTLSRGAKLHIY